MFADLASIVWLILVILSPEYTESRISVVTISTRYLVVSVFAIL